MNKKYILVEVPGRWTPTFCDCCPLKECMVDENTIPNFCPLANAKEAVEVKAGDIDRVAPDDILAFGKPAKIWATQEDK